MKKALLIALGVILLLSACKKDTSNITLTNVAYINGFTTNLDSGRLNFFDTLIPNTSYSGLVYQPIHNSSSVVNFNPCNYTDTMTFFYVYGYNLTSISNPEVTIYGKYKDSTRFSVLIPLINQSGNTINLGGVRYMVFNGEARIQ